ncbi:13651_t:CDS:1, partial [Ambispora leptoticha]
MPEVLRGYREQPAVGTPKDYFDLYAECWDDEPSRRPIVEHVIKRLMDLKFQPVLSKEEMSAEKIDEKSTEPFDSRSSSNGNMNSLDSKIQVTDENLYLLPLET